MDEDEGTCEVCGEVYGMYGDGYMGLCPSCADDTEPTEAQLEHLNNADSGPLPADRRSEHDRSL